MKKLALLQATHSIYPFSLRTTINHVEHREGVGKCLSNWTFQLHPRMEEILKKQLKEDGYFHIFGYSALTPRHKKTDIQYINGDRKKFKSLEGSGKVDNIFRVIEFKYSSIEEQPNPDPDYSFDDGISNEYEEKTRGWYWINEVRDIRYVNWKNREWQSFRDYETERYLTNKPQDVHNSNCYWVYIIDEPIFRE